ncbi:hypothetical protein OUZ56_000005 [Daphnia magna]|uniref:Uncharacterized protein n=1 Tax=Daphnia magna TaxID=35525 RepID=A0ABQ9ZYF7_9CRUS|nr:hypothetical protein OUZ56_000005 [Daphnia magna]
MPYSSSFQPQIDVGDNTRGVFSPAMSSIQQVLSQNYDGSSAATSAYYGSSDFYSTLKLQPGPSANYNQVHLNTEYSTTDESTRSFSPSEIGTRNNPQHSDTLIDKLIDIITELRLKVGSLETVMDHDNTDSICMATCMKAALTDELMDQLQWKPKRGEDSRFGLSVLIHFISVLGATLKLRCRAKGQQEPTCQDLKKVLQKCRKEGGSRHRKWLKTTGRPPVNNPPAEDSVGSDVENQIFVINNSHWRHYEI